jgi:hypothetical protein
MKTTLLLIAIASFAILFIPSDGLEAKTRVSFGVDVGTSYAAPTTVYCPPPIMVRQPVYYGHVPVGQRYYPESVVVYPYSRVPQEIIVRPTPPSPRWHNNFSFNWRIFR